MQATRPDLPSVVRLLCGAAILVFGFVDGAFAQKKWAMECKWSFLAAR